MQAVIYTPDEVLAYELDFGRRMANGDKSACREYLDWVMARRRLRVQQG
jgi:hypothetical protein